MPFVSLLDILNKKIFYILFFKSGVDFPLM